MYNNADPHEAAKSYQQRVIREREVFKEMFNELPSFTPIPTPDDFPIFAVKTKVMNPKVLEVSR